MTFTRTHGQTIHTDHHTPMLLETGHTSDGSLAVRVKRMDGTVVPFTREQARRALQAIDEIQHAAEKAKYNAVMQIIGDEHAVSESEEALLDALDRLPPGAAVFTWGQEISPDH
ncbi:hypothetical protein [Nocardia sp. NBC_01009]|uniref:hypothetical protein n=1 Tax=Nocardia sp. NBC_01009 TaxID=2975996 RepID=UPI0038664641|nr:hypothetical protein OHA42_03120 [Nocardia sp. NBC_01009]